MKNRDIDRPAGEVPNPITPPSGCHFHPRCPLADSRCQTEAPDFTALGAARVRCHAVGADGPLNNPLREVV
ncbi:oligopeptide/dipeptide ABC transporter ATP-binding protein [Aquicoccus sp. G2-2]|uniref:oligopeptide/dipeptide ABC transporter ATP-binding protein n=1 Tax=Aquicoccus sp. G2-2 TaxID=3092120 RepID=UPI002ADF3C60|nr:oligopeptide/dipeptide ABC transporter ATP-binding protein [Aquicoccus sp. G2-2]MEA1114784.1 oligopeptide/dipeptide ABC transporter ATP-binding protein [Aquicoccus sp. G2-2]